MPHCIVTSHPDYLKLLKESGLKEQILKAKISVWQEKTGNLDRFPTVAELNNLVSSPNISIKPGVSELFESNFLIFAESKTSDEVISKLLSNKIIDKKCN